MTINVLSNDSSYNLIKEGLTAANTRAQVISNNMANINTANYKKFDVIFEENLKSKNKDMSVTMKRTKSNHLTVGNSKDGNISIVRDESTSMKEDGNNVDLEVEKFEQAANTMKYNALIEQANTKLSNIKYVISGGN